jgi:hypothetical protein
MKDLGEADVILNIKLIKGESGITERKMGLNISYNRFLCLTCITNHVD